jgi:hypothetical protein
MIDLVDRDNFGEWHVNAMVGFPDGDDVWCHGYDSACGYPTLRVGDRDRSAVRQSRVNRCGRCLAQSDPGDRQQ